MGMCWVRRLCGSVLLPTIAGSFAQNKHPVCPESWPVPCQAQPWPHTAYLRHCTSALVAREEHLAILPTEGMRHLSASTALGHPLFSPFSPSSWPGALPNGNRTFSGLKDILYNDSFHRLCQPKTLRVRARARVVTFHRVTPALNAIRLVPHHPYQQIGGGRACHQPRSELREPVSSHLRSRVPPFKNRLDAKAPICCPLKE